MQFTRYYESMRPRLSNPTYNSSSVGSSMGILMYYPEQPRRQQPAKLESHNLPLSSSYQELNNHSKGSAYRPGSKDAEYAQQQQYSLQTQRQPKSRAANTKLSRYGSHSLTSLPKQISDRDIYEKQSKRYNIISVKPIENTETIRKYPKLHLENMDENFYRKLQLESQYTKCRNEMFSKEQGQQPKQSKMSNPEGNSQGSGFEQSARQKTAAQQNEAQVQDSLDQHVSVVRHQNNENHRGSFRAKMLNNVDELYGLM